MSQNKIKPEKIKQTNSQGIKEPFFERAIATFTHAADDPELQQLDEQIRSMMEFSGNMVTVGKETSKGSICKVCGKEGKSIDIKRHIEVNHITGVTHSCDICGKNSRSRHGLRQHKTSHHSQSISSF